MGKVKDKLKGDKMENKEVEEVKLKTIKKKKKGKKLKKDIIKGKVELLTEWLNEDKKESDPLQGFKVLKWKLSRSEAVHQLFIKKHTAPVADMSKEKPEGRTLLCHNVPPFLSEVHLKELFQTFGFVTRVFIHQKPTVAVQDRVDEMFPTDKDVINGFRVAYIVFGSEKQLNEVVEMDPDEVEPVVLKRKPDCGISKWTDNYNKRIHSVPELETSVRTFMENFDKEEVKRKAIEKNGGQPDDDGWITVTRTGKRASGGLVRSEAMEERLRAKKRRQDKQLMNVTPAQVKETKMKQLLELKKKFEEDKQRVALLKQQRKFRPF